MTKTIIFALGLLLAVPAFSASAAASAAAAAAEKTAAEHPEAKPYKKKAKASENVDAALARALASDKRVLLVMGANWCHDSRGLAGWFEQPRFCRHARTQI